MNEPTGDIEGRLNASPTGQHLLLGEFVIPIGVDPTSENRSVSDGLLRGWIDEDGELQVSIFARDIGSFTTLGTSLREALDALQAQVDAGAFEEQASDTDLKDVLVNIGALADGGATPLDLDGGTATVGDLLVEDDLTITDKFLHNGNFVRFFGGTGFSQLTVIGATGGNTALQNLLQALETYGLIVDSTT